MKQDKLIQICDGLELKTECINSVYAICRNDILDAAEAEHLLYSVGRDIRFELFIALYDAVLYKDPTAAFVTFREAYITSDNIYKQIQNSQYKFDIKNFLNWIVEQGVDINALMRKNEEAYYNRLPDHIKIYRGVSKKEHESEKYGISWAITEKQAKDYTYFKKNNVPSGMAGIVDINVNKKDILTVFCIGEECELIYLV